MAYSLLIIAINIGCQDLGRYMEHYGEKTQLLPNIDTKYDSASSCTFTLFSSYLLTVYLSLFGIKFITKF